MPTRRIPLVTDSIYHVYNRGVNKSTIFHDQSDYSRFITYLSFYRKVDYPYSLFEQLIQKRSPTTPEEDYMKLFTELYSIVPPVSILAYCLMPNHFHLILKQEVEDGIRFFMHKIGTSYAQYVNHKHGRTGTLFEGRFKYVLVEDQEQLDYVSRYIHRNPTSLSNNTSSSLSSYEWSSFHVYLNGEEGESFVNTHKIMMSFNHNTQMYREYVIQNDVKSEVEILENITIDNDFNWYDAPVKGRALNHV